MPQSFRNLSLIPAIFALTCLTGCVGVSVTAQERPIAQAFDDFGTRADLNARLLAEDPRLFANVSTVVVEGRVHLAGTVDTQEQRTRAGQLAWAAPNVREVINNLEVTEAGGLIDTANDRWISGQVRARILGDDTIRDSNYTIDTQNHVVYVMGIAQDSGELDRVLRHAAVVSGVRQVVNYAVLKDDPRRFGPVKPVAAPQAMAPAPSARVDIGRAQDMSGEPPVLADDQDGDQTAGNTNYLPQPVEVQPLAKQPGGVSGANGAPRSLIR